jgi:hypothetical protein
MSHATLTQADRSAIVDLTRRLGAHRLARELGIDRSSIAAVIAGTETRGTRALVANALPRLRAELARHDATGGDHGLR